MDGFCWTFSQDKIRGYTNSSILFLFRMMVCVLVFQLLMVGVFLLKEVWFAAVFLAPLILTTAVFWLYVNETYAPYSKYLSLQETVGMKYADQRFVEVG